MTLAIDELIAAESPDEALASLLSIAVGLGFPVTSWKPTGVIRTILVIVATKASASSTLIAYLAKLGFLDWAEFDWLTMLAKAVYNVDRIDARYAQTTVTLTNSTASAFDADALSMHVTDARGVSFTNLNAVHVGASASADVPMRAEVVGAGGTVAASSLTHFVAPVIGLSATNASAAVGTDAETDPDLRQRCRDKLGSLSFAGPPGAFAYAVKSSATVAPITRATVRAVATNGHVRVVIATGGGAPTSGDLAIATAAAIAYAPQGVTVDVLGATEHPIVITADVWISGGALTDVQVAAAAKASITTYLSQRPIGGVIIPPSTTGIIDREGLVGCLYALGGVVKATLSIPSTDVSLADTEVATVTTVAVAVHRV